MSINIKKSNDFSFYASLIIFVNMTYTLHKCNHLGYKMIHTFALTRLKYSIKTEPNINSKGQIKTYWFEGLNHLAYFVILCNSRDKLPYHWYQINRWVHQRRYCVSNKLHSEVCMDRLSFYTYL